MMFLCRANSCIISNIIQMICCSYKQRIRNMSITKKPVLYGDEASPPMRFAMMTASILNIDLEIHKIDLFKAENKTEFYKKINPLQKVPALSVNNDIIICDSHAIALYFCRNSKSQELYPEDTLIRAKIDELLYFNSGVLFPIDSAIFSEYFAGKWPVDEIKVNSWYSSLDHLELKLSKQKWLLGDTVRLCDICCGATISSLAILVPLLKRHEKVKEWLKGLESYPGFEINTRGLKRLQSFIKMGKMMKLQ